MADDPEWKISPHDLGTHAFTAADDEGVSESLCKQQLALWQKLGDLKEVRETRACIECQLAFGEMLADRHGEAMWRAR